jgi:hypothetical protein
MHTLRSQHAAKGEMTVLLQEEGQVFKSNVLLRPIDWKLPLQLYTLASPIHSDNGRLMALEAA